MALMIRSRSRLGSVMPPTRLSYMQIADDIQARIASGEYQPGGRLPSYSQMAQMYSCSVSTAQNAMRELRARGLTRSHQGRGVFVAGDDPTT